MVYGLLIAIILGLLLSRWLEQRQRENGGMIYRPGGIVLGCCIVVLVVMGLYRGINSSDERELSAGVTARPTATAVSEKPTDTPMPEFAKMPPEDAVSDLARYYSNVSVQFDSVMEYDGLVNVQSTITSNILNERMAVQRMCQYVLHIAEHAFESPDIDSLVFYFDAEVSDKYGNINTRRVADINISRATAQKINYKWMINRTYVSTKDVLAVFDDYSIQPSLSNGLD